MRRFVPIDAHGDGGDEAAVSGWSHGGVGFVNWVRQNVVAKWGLSGWSGRKGG